MKDHEIRQLVDRLVSVAKKYHDMQQLREQIAHCIRPLQQDPMDGMWHKIVALIMIQKGLDMCTVSLEEIQALPSDKLVVVREMPDGLLIRLISKEDLDT